MANTVNLKIKISDDGSLSVTAKNAEKAAAATEKLAKSTDKTGKARNKYSKGEKGVAGATSNSTKAFSKMRNSMTGEGGLVPAYATLAANVFAVTAAFGILQRSAAVKQLEEGLIFTGRAAGQNLPFLVESLKEITGAALSTADAMRAVAVGVSAGFSQTQLEGLTKVAKGASLALGRDMTDAMDRLVRGAAKLEPEILDELGIMVRLDEASENFATSIGKTANELTQFEKRMAFTNAIITQGEIKFGALAKVIDPNPYDQLAATFDNLTKKSINLFNTVLQPVIEVLGQNMVVLAGGIAALGGSVVRQMVPALTQSGTAMAELATEAANAGKANLKSLKSFQGAPKVFNELVDSVADGTASLKDRKRLLDSLDRSEQKHMNTMDEQIKKHGKESKTIKEKEAKLEGVQLARQKLTETTELNTKASVLNTRAAALNQASQGQLITSLRTVRVAFVADIAATNASTASKAGLTRALAFLKVGFANAALAAKAFGIAILNMIPIVGQVLLVLGMIIPMIVDFFSEPPTALEEAIKKNEERFSDLDETLGQLSQTYLTSTTNAERFFAVLNTTTGLIDQNAAAMESLVAAQESTQIANRMKARIALYKSEQKLQKAISGNSEDSLGFFRTFTNVYHALSLANLGAGAQAEKYARQLNDVTRAEDEVASAQERLNEALKATGVDAGATAEGMQNLLVANIASLSQAREVAYAMGKNSEEVELLNKRIQKTKDITKALFETGDYKAALEAYRAFNIEQKKIQEAAKSASDAVKAFNQNFLSATDTAGPLGSIIDDLSPIIQNLTGDVANYTAVVEKYSEVFKQLGLEGRTVEELASKFEKLEKVNEAILDLKTTEHYAKELSQLHRQTDLTAFAAEEQARLGQEKVLNLQRLEEEYRSMGLVNAAENIRLQILAAELEVEKQLATAAKARVNSQFANAGMSSVGQLQQGLTGLMNAMADSEDITASDQIAAVRASFSGLIDDMKKLGPDGEVVAAVSAAAFAMSENFTLAFEKMEAKTLTLTDKLALAGTMVNALGQIQAAQSKAAEAGINREIEAEKRRDGKSAESVAKIQSLEKKKESQKKKAFEVNKKIQMASIMISTAAAAAAAWAPPPLGSGPLFGGFLSAAIVALGAAQLAIVSGTSYQGGGGSIGGGGNPTSVSMGQRRNSVDLASSQSSRGELAYMRGERGSGGPENFRSAFSGYRNRAEGGNTGLIVGEQGPELFVPEVPGRVVPNDDIEAGAATNVSFNINTIDASGVEDMLLNQQGNIIGMIRQAANSYGQDFVEEVDTMTLAPNSTGAVSRY